MKRITTTGILAAICSLAFAQQPQMLQNPDDTEHVRLDYLVPRTDLWRTGEIPGSKGLELTDSIYLDRTRRIIMPRIYTYLPDKDKSNGTAILVIPGGGYSKQAYEVAGHNFAKWLNSNGYTAFVLIHRLPNSPDLTNGSIAPTQDAQRAIRYIRAHAAEYGIDPDKVGVMGASSGGHVAACVNTIEEDWSAAGDELDKYRYRPDYAILISPVISMDDPIAHKGSRSTLLGDKSDDQAARDRFSMQKHVTPSTPPMFFVHASNDTGVPQQNSIQMYSALISNGVIRSSLHIFPQGQHNISLEDQPGSTDLWPEILLKWLAEDISCGNQK